MIFQAGRRTAKKMGKNAHFVLKICTNRFRDYIHVTYFCNKRLHMYVSALQLPISVFSKTFDCKDTEKKQNGIKKQ